MTAETRVGEEAYFIWRTTNGAKVSVFHFTLFRTQGIQSYKMFLPVNAPFSGAAAAAAAADSIFLLYDKNGDRMRHFEGSYDPGNISSLIARV